MSTKLPLFITLLLPACASSLDVSQRESAETTTDTDRDVDSHHREMYPADENPGPARTQARLDGTLVAQSATPLPDPKLALQTLNAALSRVASGAVGTAPSGAFQKLQEATERVINGQASLSQRAFCLGGGGLTRWLGEQRSTTDDLAALARAKDDVCAQIQSYQRKSEADWSTMVLDASDDGYGGLLLYDPLYPVVQPDLGLELSDGHDCVTMGVKVPDYPGGGTIYDLDAYRLDSDTFATVEAGMKIGPKPHCAAYTKPVVMDPCQARFGQACPTKVEYSANIAFSYTKNGVLVNKPFYNVSTNGSFGGVLVYKDVPIDVIEDGRTTKNTDITLTYQVVRRECIPLADQSNSDYPEYNCTLTNLGAPQSLTFRTVPLGSMCQAAYSYDEFTVNDRLAPKNEFEATQVTTIDGPGVTSAPPFNSVFHAYAWVPVVDPNNPKVKTSSFPSPQQITDGDWFAIHAEDQNGLTTHSLWTQPFFAFNKTDGYPGHNFNDLTFADGEGTNVISGLAFPRVETANPYQGFKPYSFTCRPPRIVRDYVAFCSWSDEFQYTDRRYDSAYLLPWHGTTHVEQGNDGIYSHKMWTEEEYAWDFTSSLLWDDTIYAARGGVVTHATGWYSGGSMIPGDCMIDSDIHDPNSPLIVDVKAPDHCNPNVVYVTHQDGTMARYLHLEHHGVHVHDGDVVRRGDDLGHSGMTGHASNEHIHFDVQGAKSDGSGPAPISGPGDSTSSIRVEFDEGSHPCDLPLVLEMPLSTMSTDPAEDYNFRSKDWVNDMPEARLGDVPKLAQNCPGAANKCGGCTPLQVTIGGSCAPGYVWACDGENAVECVQDLPKNACGGTTPLQHQPGSMCPGYKLNNECWTCKTPDLVTCQDACP
jgi:peptidase M23-like protein